MDEPLWPIREWQVYTTRWVPCEHPTGNLTFIDTCEGWHFCQDGDTDYRVKYHYPHDILRAAAEAAGGEA